MQELKQATKNLMKRVTKVERRCDEFDKNIFPKSRIKLSWEKFLRNFKSDDLSYQSVKDKANNNLNERIDLRPYLILNPHTCFTTDNLTRILDIYRQNHLRLICVLKTSDG